MKVILIKNSIHGKAGEIKDFKDGFALNFLLPQKIALKADSKNISQWQMLASKVQKKQNQEQLIINSVLKKLDKTRLTLSAKANSQGHLYAAINDKDIIAVIKNKHAIDLNPYKVKLLDTIKNIGEFDTTLVVNNNNISIKLIINHDESPN